MQADTARPGISRSTKLLATFILLFLFVLIIFMVWPIDDTAPAWMGQVQGSTRYSAQVVGPFLFVALLGGIIGVAELTSTFKTYPREALLTRWAWVLILANAVAAAVAMLVLRATMPQMNLITEILAVGLGFQAIIRTRFVLAKQVGANNDGEVAVNLGWLYDQFSNLARRQIDLELMNNRRTAVIRLIQYYPTLAELYDIALYTITARETFTLAEEEAKRAELEKLIDPKAPEQFAKTSVALMILENGGQAYVDLLLTQAMGQPTMAAILPAPPRQETIVRQLVDNYDVDGLVALTDQLTDNEAVRNYVRAAARPEATISVAEQKATIAHFLTQQVGPEALHDSLET
jgi:hypothetical protein